MPSLIAQVSKARDDFRMAMGRDPTHGELAASVGISVGRLKLILSASREPVSLDRELLASTTDQRTLADTLADERNQSPDEWLESRMHRQTLAKALITGKHPILDAGEHTVICSCYDLIEGRGYPLSHEEIAKRFGKTADWVEKVEARAMKKLKGRPQLRNLLATRNVGSEYMSPEEYSEYMTRHDEGGEQRSMVGQRW